MKKTFKMFLWSLRWLLVFSLPIVGLFTAVALMPEYKPLWEIKSLFGESAGILADEEQPYFLVLKNSDRENKKVVYYQGYDMNTGKEWFTEQYTTKLEDAQSSFIPGTACLVRHSGGEIEIYDTHLRQYIGTFRLPAAAKSIRSLAFKNNIFALRTEERNTSDIIFYFWHRDTGQLVTMPCEVMPYRQEIELSRCARWALVLGFDRSYQRINGYVANTSTGERIQKLPQNTHILEVRWHPDEDAFLALELKDDDKTKCWRKYVLNDQRQFAPVGSSVPLVRQNGFPSRQSPSRFVVQVESTETNKTRKKLEKLLGSWAATVLDNLWPHGITFDLYEATSGKLVNSMTLQGVQDTVLLSKVHPDPSGRGLILEQVDRIAYWEFNPPRERYPWYGLMAGSLGSALLLYFNLRGVWRRSPKPI